MEQTQQAGRRKTTAFARFSVFVGILTIILIMGIFLSLHNETNPTVSIPQDTPATLTIGEKTYTDVDLSTFTFSHAPAGTEITLRTVLKGSIEDPHLLFFAKHAKLKVFVDGTLIYSYGDTNKHLYSYGYLLFPLPADYEGKELVVEQLVMENKEVSSVRIPEVVNGKDYISAQLNDKKIYLFYDIAMIIMGLSVLVVSMIFIRSMPQIRNLIWVSVALCGIGIWVFCSSSLILIFARNNLELKGYLEYLSLYVTPPFFILYFAQEYYDNEKSRLLRRIYLVLITALIAFPGIACILHFTDVIHLPRILLASHILLAACFSYVLFMNIRQIVKRQFQHMGMLLGSVLMVVVGLLDMINFAIHRFLSAYINNNYNSIILIGLFLFAMCMIVDFLGTQQINLVMEAKSEALEKIAYVDVMTGICNRHRCDQEMTEIAAEKGKRPFAILNFDLNNLKKTNDHFGHSEGDRLLTDFAGLLTEVFSESGLVGRMGGDEFIVILRDLRKTDTDALIRTLHETCETLNKERQPVPLSFAWGMEAADPDTLAKMAGADEPQRLRFVQEVYQRADVKMYQNKAAMKAAENRK